MSGVCPILRHNVQLLLVGWLVDWFCFVLLFFFTLFSFAQARLTITRQRTKRSRLGHSVGVGVGDVMSRCVV
jgi:hypothetical protein